MTPEFALKLGWAAGRVLGRKPGARVLIGKDTRRSGYMFESALEAGFASAGVEVDLLGPLPTPGVAYLTRALRAQAGVVISASHNPHEDNGVKFFSAEGGKLSDELEEEIERELDAELRCVASEQLGRARRIDDAQGRYIEFCKSTFPLTSLSGMHVVLDCANGAAYKVAPAVFSELGARVTAIGVEPNGFNINRDCGSTHLQALQATVLRTHADVGIALDGDADRCLMVDAHGHEVDGDQLLYIIASGRKQAGLLKGPVVGTQMSNLGLEQALRAQGIAFERAKVGDRHVLERLNATGGFIGGESSGHILCLDCATTGDGIVTALQVLAQVIKSGKSLGELLAGMSKFPQVLINVPVTGAAKKAVELPAVLECVRQVELQLGGSGRVLLRPSGTEPLIRVMVEAEDAAQTRTCAEQIAKCVREGV
jgi:phosphoglucosamine mutase